MSALLTPIEVQEKLSAEHLVTSSDLTRSDIELIFASAHRMKRLPGEYAHSLQGRQLAMIFEKPSLRTRVTFEAGMTSMGGSAIFLDHAKPRLGERECIKDVARNLSRWVHGIVARTFSHQAVVELAENASIPVINGLTDFAHPCQALADYFTLEEKFGSVDNLRLAFVGDGNNVCNSLMIAGAKLGASVRVASPAGFAPAPAVVEEARALGLRTGASVEIFDDPSEAVEGCHAVYTDVWASMGQEHAAHLREQVFAPYQVTEKLMAAARPGALFMHCLPAHRGKEVEEAVIDSPCSVVYDQAENRLHVQKAILLLLMTR